LSKEEIFETDCQNKKKYQFLKFLNISKVTVDGCAAPILFRLLVNTRYKQLLWTLVIVTDY